MSSGLLLPCLLLVFVELAVAGVAKETDVVFDKVVGIKDAAVTGVKTESLNIPVVAKDHDTKPPLITAGNDVVVKVKPKDKQVYVVKENKVGARKSIKGKTQRNELWKNKSRNKIRKTLRKPLITKKEKQVSDNLLVKKIVELVRVHNRSGKGTTVMIKNLKRRLFNPFCRKIIAWKKWKGKNNNRKKLDKLSPKKNTRMLNTSGLKKTVKPEQQSKIRSNHGSFGRMQGRRKKKGNLKTVKKSVSKPIATGKLSNKKKTVKVVKTWKRKNNKVQKGQKETRT